jgi:hypothetical protein
MWPRVMADRTMSAQSRPNGTARTRLACGYSARTRVKRSASNAAAPRQAAIATATGVLSALSRSSTAMAPAEVRCAMTS